MKTLRDRDLTIEMQGGSLEALGKLYDRHRMLVYRTALVITNDHEAASDLLQEVFLRLYRFADRIDSQRPLEPWLYRMTANLAYTWIKRNKRWLRPIEDLADWLAGPSRNVPDEVVERQDDWARVQKAVSNLPIAQRVVVVLYYLNDLSVQEIAEILDVPAGTVKSRLHYGRSTLKKHLGMGATPEGDSLADLNFEGY